MVHPSNPSPLAPSPVTSAHAAGARLVVALLILVPLLTACQPDQGISSSGGISEHSGLVVYPPAQGQPTIRVHLARYRGTVRITGPATVRITAGSSTYRARTPLDLARRGSGFVLAPAGASASWLGAAALTVEPEASTTIGYLSLDGTPYPGRLILHISDSDAPANAIEAVNAAALEQYLPGVIAKELLPSWPVETYRAQAVAARTYALWQAVEARGRPWDLEGSQAGQAYVGLTRNPVAVAAVRDTAGQVLTWHGSVFPAYYSACCGGTGQDAAAAIPGAPDIEPLRGRYHGPWCAACPQYRWGPVTRTKSDLVARFAAWGRANRHPIAAIASLRDIQISGRNSVSRPTWFTVIDRGGRYWHLGPEQFRAACNFQDSSTAPLHASAMLESSHVEVRVSADQGTVHFLAGRGFGHGVGLCQWGARALAIQGYAYRSILAFYYPGAAITKLY
jgi:stage II sporulation protein D